MIRSGTISRLLTMALAAIVLAAVLVPVCQMPECTDITVGSCSDFQPACDDCPKAAVMKHTPDEALASAAPSLGELAAIAPLQTSPEPIAVSLALSAPAVTASPPPLDPLGVRLTI